MYLLCHIFEINGAKSNAGQNLSYFIRGGRNRQVLILIDGIAVTDPSQIANDYDLRLLNADQVESIEILKGAASTLYGSGAASAVINVKLKEAKQNKLSTSFTSVLGTNMSSSDDNYAIEDFRNSIIKKKSTKLWLLGQRLAAVDISSYSESVIGYKSIKDLVKEL